MFPGQNQHICLSKENGIKAGLLCFVTWDSNIIAFIICHMLEDTFEIIIDFVVKCTNPLRDSKIQTAGEEI